MRLSAASSACFLVLVASLLLASPPAAAQQADGRTTRTTVDGRPLASSLPAKGGSRRPQFAPIAFDQLNHHIGDRVEVTTIYGNRREGRVEGVSGQTLRLKSSAGLGYAVTNFERNKIRSIISME
jgi:hypothetical protein